MTSIDRLTRDLTCFENQDQLLNAPGGYRPTIQPRRDDRRYEVLADAYDIAQAARGDERRAYRNGGITHWFAPVASERLAGVKHGSGLASQWLKVIWEINRQAPDSIGEPWACYWAYGGWTEEYPRFRVILLGDENTSGETAEIQALDDDAATWLKRAAAKVRADREAEVKVGIARIRGGSQCLRCGHITATQMAAKKHFNAKHP